MANVNVPQLEADVLSALLRDHFIKPLNMDVQVDNDGVVTLAGSIDSEINRQTAEGIARNVEGVTDVRNYLTLMGQESSSRSDEEITRDVIASIGSDPTLENSGRFHVRTQYARVYLSGTAESWEEHESVMAAARRVPGIEVIEDRLELKVPRVKA